MNMQEDRHHDQAHLPRRPHGHFLSSAVVSGDSDPEEDDESSAGGDDLCFRENSDIFEDAGEYSASGAGVGVPGEEEHDLFRFDRNHASHQDELYDHNLDDEDEAYVYRHMRGGTEKVHRRKNQPSDPAAGSAADTYSAETPAVLRPRNSDAVLSCPCCFNIVCMDCQRHQKYLNQFRAMFVMGIMVDWQSRLVYDQDQQYLMPKPEHLPNQVPTEELNHIGEKRKNDSGLDYKDGEYFPVLCGNCRTQVAALEMVEEVYHFHGCLESS